MAERIDSRTTGNGDASADDLDLSIPPDVPIAPGPGPAVARPRADRAPTAAAPRPVPAPETDGGSTPTVAHARPASPASPVRGNGHAAEPDAMRREIEATRARMSRTLDELELRLVAEKRALERKKEALWAKATLRGVRRKLAEEPFRSMAIAFAAGYIIAAIRD